MKEFKKQLDVKKSMNLFKTKLKGSNSRLKKEETQEAKDEAARLVAEAAIFEKVQNEDHDPKALPNPLLDFVDESLEFAPSTAVVGHLPIIPKPVTGLFHEAEVNRSWNCIINQSHCRSC